MADYIALLNFLNDVEDTDNVENALARPMRVYRDPFNLPDESFCRRYRFSKQTILNVLLPMVDREISYKSERNCAATSVEQLLVFLRFLATSSFQVVSGDLSTVTPRHESSISRYVHRVARAIAGRSGQYIQLPRPHEWAYVHQRFQEIHGFFGVIGLIDGAQIPIASPGGPDAEIYRNRKNQFALNVQVVCDANMVIRDIVSRWFGSAHDARVFDNSSVKYQFETKGLPGLLLGDAGYPLRTYLMTPLASPGTEPEVRYNRAHKSTRILIERMFGVWKRRFPALHYGLRFKPDRAAIIIVAAAVLHNIARGAGEPDFQFGLEAEANEEGDFEETSGPAALAARRVLIANHFA